MIANGETPVTPANGGVTIGRIEQINQLVRALCVVLLLGGFVFAFVWGVFLGSKVVVSSDAFISVLTVALTWWFKSRDDQQRRADMAPPPGTVTTTTTAPATVTTDTTIPTAAVTPPPPSSPGGLTR